MRLGPKNKNKSTRTYGKWFILISKNWIQSGKDFTYGLRIPPPKMCCGLWWQSSKRDSAVVWATIGLESCDLHRWLCHRDSVPQLCTFWGISVTVARPVVIWQLMVHSGLPRSHSWLEAPPCPESSGKMLPKLGREGGFQKPSATKTDNLTAESEEAWDFGSLHSLALFHESKAL